VPIYLYDIKLWKKYSQKSLKLFEKCTLIRLKREMEDKQILRPHQYGFRDELGTVHQLATIKQEIENAFKNGKIKGMVTIDIIKAYDRAWHQGIIYKMLKLEIQLALVKLFNSLLSERKLFVFKNGASSKLRDQKAGLTQGGPSSPDLWNINVSDAPELCHSGKYTYADDMAFTSQGTIPDVIDV